MEQTNKIKRKRGRPKKVTFKIPSRPPPPPSPSPPSPVLSPTFNKPKRVMTRDDVDKRINYLKRKISFIKCPLHQEKYRNLLFKYQRGDIEII